MLQFPQSYKFASDFKPESWVAVATVGNSPKPIENGVTYEMINHDKFKANVSYNEIYPPCDLILYRKTIQGGREEINELKREVKDGIPIPQPCTLGRCLH